MFLWELANGSKQLCAERGPMVGLPVHGQSDSRVPQIRSETQAQIGIGLRRKSFVSVCELFGT
jgi:hypothetical protein